MRIMRGSAAAASHQPPRPSYSESNRHLTIARGLSVARQTGVRTHRRTTCQELQQAGAALGPACDAIHNQSLLQYDVLPIGDVARTSLLIPPLLALTYELLGGVLTAVARRIAPGGAAAPLIDDQRLRTVAAVAATCAVIKLSAVLIAAETPYAFFVLAAAALVQWATLDGTYASLLLGTVVAVAGPLAEIPFEELGCWQYYSPDYFPFGQDLPGISSLTGPCYFAVTQDAQALGRLFDDDERDV